MIPVFHLLQKSIYQNWIMTKKQNYDTAMAELEQLVAELESETAVSMEEYAKKAKHATELIAYCTERLRAFDADLQKIVQQNQ